MTLFLLLVTISAISPLAAVVAEASRHGVMATAVAAVAAVLLGLLQWFGHHRFVRRWLANPGGNQPAAASVAAYDALILVGGVLSSLLAAALARTLS